MGQAFDRNGNVLGEASGETKREVFDALLAKHPDAHEIRIKSMREQLDAALAERNVPTTPVDRMEQFFRFAHLPVPLQAVSKPFAQLAAQIVATLPSNPERTVALRKLLEAKDCAVRAVLYEEPMK